MSRREYVKQLFGLRKESNTQGKGAVKTSEMWSMRIEEPMEIECMAVSDDTLFIAGVVNRFERTKSFVWAVSGKDGKKLMEAKLASPPAAQGVALTEGRLYVTTTAGKLMCFGDR